MRLSARSTTALLARAALLAALLVLTACGRAPSTGAAVPPPDMTAPATDANGRPLVDQPLSNAPASVAEAGTPGEVDYSCTTDADCAVKDVGSCCGYSPACVNANSPTFPEQVRAECERTGMQSVCGFREITGCQCVEGRCSAIDGGEGPVR